MVDTGDIKYFIQLWLSNYSPIFLLYFLMIMLILSTSWWSIIINRCLWQFNLKLCKVKLGDNIFPQSPFLFITGISSQFFFFFFLIRGFRQSLVNNVWESPVITFQPREHMQPNSLRFLSDPHSNRLIIIQTFNLKENKEDKARNKDKFSLFLYL